MMDAILPISLTVAAGKYDGGPADGAVGSARGQSRAFATPIVSPHHVAAVT